MSVFRIKICGVRTEADVRAVAQSAADAVGLNFYPPSVRFVDPGQPTTLALSRTAAELGLVRVGVFVNEPSDSIRRVAERVGLDAIQLHGDESVEAGRNLSSGEWSLIRALRIGADEGCDEIDAKARPWIELGCDVLLDADAGGDFGGGGRSLNWKLVERWANGAGAGDWILAGGLDPDNVAAAVRASGARRLDVASGVEQPRGEKSPARIGAFGKAAQQAWSEIAGRNDAGASESSKE